MLSPTLKMLQYTFFLSSLFIPRKMFFPGSIFIFVLYFIKERFIETFG